MNSVISLKAVVILQATANAQASTTAQPQAATLDISKIPYFGSTAKYATPNKLTQWRVQTFQSKERDMLAWIETFAGDDVLVDIGANVGMYFIWTSARRRISVIFFEPRSQNYALLNQNIFINGMSEQIQLIAWQLLKMRASTNSTLAGLKVAAPAIDSANRLNPIWHQ